MQRERRPSGAVLVRAASCRASFHPVHHPPQQRREQEGEHCEARRRSRSSARTGARTSRRPLAKSSVVPSGMSIAASLPNSAASVSENAVARNHVPIIRLATRRDRQLRHRRQADRRQAHLAQFQHEVGEHQPPHARHFAAGAGLLRRPCERDEAQRRRAAGPTPISPAWTDPARAGPAMPTARRTTVRAAR